MPLYAVHDYRTGECIGAIELSESAAQLAQSPTAAGELLGTIQDHAPYISPELLVTVDASEPL